MTLQFVHSLIEPRIENVEALRHDIAETLAPHRAAVADLARQIRALAGGHIEVVAACAAILAAKQMLGAPEHVVPLAWQRVTEELVAEVADELTPYST